MNMTTTGTVLLEKTKTIIIQVNQLKRPRIKKTSPEESEQRYQHQVQSVISQHWFNLDPD